VYVSTRSPSRRVTNSAPRVGRARRVTPWQHTNKILICFKRVFCFSLLRLCPEHRLCVALETLHNAFPIEA
jgi:hypothetical protein